MLLKMEANFSWILKQPSAKVSLTLPVLTLDSLAHIRAKTTREDMTLLCFGADSVLLI